MKVFSLILLLSFFIPKFGNAQDEKPEAIERACPNIFSFNKNNKTYSFRFASNHPIDEQNKKIRHLVIYIHGARRNGLDYYEWGEKRSIKPIKTRKPCLFHHNLPQKKI